jgi:hypothetical protein
MRCHGGLEIPSRSKLSNPNGKLRDFLPPEPDINVLDIASRFTAQPRQLVAPALAGWNTISHSRNPISAPDSSDGFNLHEQIRQSYWVWMLNSAWAKARGY